MEHTRVLVIEDSVPEQLRLMEVLRAAGYEITIERTGGEGLDIARRWHPDVLVLDLGLPDMDGMEVCRQLREFSNAYVVMLTGRDDEESKFAGLELGADAYVTKPYSARELLVSIEVLLRRPRVDAPANAELEVGDLVLDPASRRVTVAGQPIKLTKIEHGLLSLFVRHPGTTISRAELTAHIWGPNWSGGDHGISVHMANLRKKLDPSGPSRIQTVRGVGYRLVEPDEAFAEAG